jgi:hypothetical protein
VAVQTTANGPCSTYSCLVVVVVMDICRVKFLVARSYRYSVVLITSFAFQIKITRDQTKLFECHEHRATPPVVVPSPTHFRTREREREDARLASIDQTVFSRRPNCRSDELEMAFCQSMIDLLQCVCVSVRVVVVNRGVLDTGRYGADCVSNETKIKRQLYYRYRYLECMFVGFGVVSTVFSTIP